MKNRDRYITGRNEYDLLVNIQAVMAGCVLEALTGKDYPCPDDGCCMLSTCKECIRKWLDEDSATQPIGEHRCEVCGAMISADRQLCRKCDPFEKWESEENKERE